MFFDGDCAFCSRSIRLLAHLDRHDRIRLSPLQGELARQNGLERFADQASGTMVVLEENGQQSLFGDSWLALCRVLGFPFNLLGVLLRCIPRSLRDAVYRGVARNRYRIAGKKSACTLPDPEVVKRLV